MRTANYCELKSNSPSRRCHEVIIGAGVVAASWLSPPELRPAGLTPPVNPRTPPAYVLAEEHAMRYRTHALILAAFAVTLGGLAAQTQKNGVGKVEAAAAPTAATSAPDAQRTRADLSALMRRFPPSVGAVLAMDHSLLGNSTYLEPYPALVGVSQRAPRSHSQPVFLLWRRMTTTWPWIQPNEPPTRRRT